MEGIDQVQLNFDPATLALLNVLIGLIMFGVALDIRMEDFKRVVRDPRGPLIGLGAQFLLLPAFTFLLIQVINPIPSIALGMLMVAACPGGNFSNFLASHAKANAAMSVSMTAISTALAIVMTPANLAFWGGRNEGTKAILTDVNLDPIDLLVTILIILGDPIGSGNAGRRQSAGHRRETPTANENHLADAVWTVCGRSPGWQLAAVS